jgi:hypothetical protein
MPGLGLVVACLALAGQAQAGMPAELAVDAFEADCEPIGKVQPEFTAGCKAAKARGERLVWRFSVDAAGQWSISPPLSGASVGIQALKAVQFEGLECLEAPLVLICQVAPGVEVLNRAGSSDSAFRSRSGLVMMATNLGVIDLMKVVKQ